MGDKETKLDNLNVELSKEEEDIVDSIIEELNTDDIKENNPNQQRQQGQQMPPNMQQRQGPPPNMQQMPPNMQQGQGQGQMPPEVMQQRMMQQQMMQQQMMQQQMMKQQMMKEEKEDEKKDELSITDKLKIDMKEPSIVMAIILIMLLPQTNGLITSTKLSFLMNVDGSINLYGLMIKALLGGLIFFIFKKYS